VHHGKPSFVHLRVSSVVYDFLSLLPNYQQLNSIPLAQVCKCLRETKKAVILPRSEHLLSSTYRRPKLAPYMQTLG